MQTILLLNPPGKKLYLRDYYCSKVSKANYINAPIDFVILSGILSKNFNIKLVDAIVQKLDIDECIKEIKNINPDIIISLTGSVSWNEDIEFIEKINRELKSCIILTGDILLAKAEEKMNKYEFIEAVILNFTSNGIIFYLNKEYDKITDLVYRNKNKIIRSNNSNEREFSIPTPLHKLFLNLDYRLPFVKKYPWATVMTDYGCPFPCSFCIIGTLGHSYRLINEVLVELDKLNSIGVKEIFFMDQTFGLNRQRTINLCEEIIKKKYRFSWFCFSRVDVMNEDMLKLMKNAGCHTIFFGVESGNDIILKEYLKGYNNEQIRKTFLLCKKIGIKTLATFIIGLPEENEETIKNTINFIREINPDYASFNFAVPRFNTKLRDIVLKENLIDDGFEIMDQVSTISMDTKYIPKEKLEKMKRKIILGFYLRPTYILKQLIDIRGINDLRIKVSSMVGLMKNI